MKEIAYNYGVTQSLKYNIERAVFRKRSPTCSSTLGGAG